jgi:hypothetical protein
MKVYQRWKQIGRSLAQNICDVKNPYIQIIDRVFDMGTNVSIQGIGNHLAVEIDSLETGSHGQTDEKIYVKIIILISQLNRGIYFSSHCQLSDGPNSLDAISRRRTGPVPFLPFNFSNKL